MEISIIEDKKEEKNDLKMGLTENEAITSSACPNEASKRIN